MFARVYAALLDKEHRGHQADELGNPLLQHYRFLMKCANETVTIELKNGTIVHGTIASVTPRMDTALRNVKMTPKGQDAVALDAMNIR